MPKRIENLRDTILTTARAQLLETGYQDFAMREAARRCGVAVGTLYNYFPSKDALAAAVMLEDWHEDLDAMKAGCAGAAGPMAALALLYDGVARYYRRYRSVWASYSFGGSQQPEYARRHRLLIRQLAAILAPKLAAVPGVPSATDLFLAENILTCAGSSEVPFSTFAALAASFLGTN